MLPSSVTVELRLIKYRIYGLVLVLVYCMRFVY